MTSPTSTVTIHMVASLDGYVVDNDGKVDWLNTSDTYEAGVAHDDPMDAAAAIGCWVIGSKTYEDALRLGWPYGDKPTYVLTGRDLASDRTNVKFRSGDLARLVSDELKPQFTSIWLCGGAALVKEFLRLGLVDAISMTIAPIIIGGGLPFFDAVGVLRPLHLRDVKAYTSGVVELSYDVRRD